MNLILILLRAFIGLDRLADGGFVVCWAAIWTLDLQS